jgi:hypothetical protein
MSASCDLGIVNENAALVSSSFACHKKSPPSRQRGSGRMAEIY